MTTYIWLLYYMCVFFLKYIYIYICHCVYVSVMFACFKYCPWQKTTTGNTCKQTDQGYQGPKLDKSAMYKCVIFFGYIMISYRFEHNCRQLDTTDLSFIMFANCFLTLKHPPGPQNTNSLLVWGPGSISFHQPRLIQPTELPLRGPCPFSVAIAAATSSGVL